MDFERSMKRLNVEQSEKWREWTEEIPALNFKPNWSVKIIPPFGGAVARFIVKCNGRSVSVYLDCFDALGCVGSPYWEIYPINNTVERFDIGEVDELVKAIELSLNSQTEDW